MFLASRADADGMSWEDESFTVNDPDEGFSSGASSSSQPSRTKSGPGVGVGAGGLRSSRKHRNPSGDPQALLHRQQPWCQSPPPALSPGAIELSPVRQRLSYPAGSAVVRTGSTLSSKSFDCTNSTLNGSQGSAGTLEGALEGTLEVTPGTARRFSMGSLQEERLGRVEEDKDLLSSGAPLSRESRSPSFSMHIISQV